jgi:TPR repeat protein
MLKMRKSKSKRKLMAVMVSVELLLTGAGLLYWHTHFSGQLSDSQVADLQAKASTGHDDISLLKLEQAAASGQISAQNATGQALLQLHEVDGALEWLQKAATQNNHDAQVTLGRLYYYGQGTLAQDYHQAFKWFNVAAQAGDASANYFMGLIYKNGAGVPVNLAASVKYFKKGAEQNHPASLFMLANAYRSGEGVVRNDRRAKRLYRRAAEMNHHEAAEVLAMNYPKLKI